MEIWLGALRYVVSAGAVLLTIGSHVALRRGSRGLDRATTYGLAVLAVVAMVDYGQPQWRAGRYFNNYEFYHYYVGSKYAAELGYTGLYAASVIAEAELGTSRLPKEVRDLGTGKRVSVAEVRKRPEVWKARFSSERWAEFKEDVRFFRTQVAGALWQRMVTDKGYNGTPVWTLVGGAFSRRTPTTHGGLKALPLLDVALFTAALASVVWAFGLRTALLVLILFCNHYVTSQPVLKAAFLRLDWLVCLVASVCMLKKGWHGTAGALTAYASMVRVFPAIFAFGLGIKLLYDFVRTRACERRHLRYVGSFIGTCAVLFAVSMVANDGSIRYWTEFFEKVTAHERAVVLLRVGFKYVFLMGWDGRAPGGGRMGVFMQHWGVVYQAVVLAAVAAVGFLLRRLRDHEAQALGYLAAFFLVAPTYYYHVMLLAPALFLLANLEDRWQAGVVAYVFASSSAMSALHAAWGRSHRTIFAVSCLLFGLVLALAALAWRRCRRPQPVATGPPNSSSPATSLPLPTTARRTPA
jgi:hypothetical protein